MNSKLLISFCNLAHPKLKRNKHSPLGVLDYKKNLVYWIKLPRHYWAVAKQEEHFYNLPILGFKDNCSG
ncbi:hypothetical protein KKD61_01810 [Patescibacteria group bacterium]|nr:hypothetical protein [Patescibacteria group bacterium]